MFEILGDIMVKLNKPNLAMLMFNFNIYLFKQGLYKSTKIHCDDNSGTELFGVWSH